MNQEEPKATRRGVLLHDSNPFLEKLATKLEELGEKEKVESTTFLKLFMNGAKAFAELSRAGTRVFELLCLELQSNVGKDQVYLSYTRLDEHQKTSLSQSIFKRGVAELLEKRFLAAMPAVGWYWINPNYLWNGDRRSFFKRSRRAST